MLRGDFGKRQKLECLRLAFYCNRGTRLLADFGVGLRRAITIQEGKGILGETIRRRDIDHEMCDPI